ncbi:tetratricopeptide repeat-containing protein [Pontixanthobacter sp.]|uniref:tetratricopeptide repeat-containing protein n=1 Tax=Pontixanthobacter sp. TaxID=2792078 RepID=UPI003C7DC766
MNPYPAIIRLARSGSPGRAWSMMKEHGLLDADADPRALTLQARLVKDRAKHAEAGERARLYADAAALYAKAGALDNASYPLINAASLSLLAGKTDQSVKLARDVLAALDANPDEAETPYWREATRAEALLLHGDEVGARTALRRAVAKQPAAYEDHAATIGQFELLCEEMGFEAGWLNQIRPPNAVQFAGLMHTAMSEQPAQRAIADWLERENIGFGYGALAAGADIWISEALAERGAKLHVILPCELTAFRDLSVTRLDFGWGDRFDRLMSAASDITVLNDAAAPSGAAVQRGDEVALGMAKRHAAALRSEAKRLRIVGAGDARTPPAPDMSAPTAIVTATRQPPKRHQPSMSGGALRWCVASGGNIGIFKTPAEALLAAKRSATAVAIDYAVAASGDIAPLVEQRVTAMVDCAEQGQCLATQEAAFALYAASTEMRVEVAGEMRWSGGAVPLFAII